MSELNGWLPIDTAPKNRLIRVCGDSGYTGHRWFDCTAYHDAEYRPREPWRDVQGEALSDNGWVPAFWRMLDCYPGE